MSRKFARDNDFPTHGFVLVGEPSDEDDQVYTLVKRYSLSQISVDKTNGLFFVIYFLKMFLQY